MNGHTKKQILVIMAPYRKRGIAYRSKQIQRLLLILDDIFRHEPYAAEQLHRIGRRQIIGYWQRTQHDSAQTRREKYAILKRFFDMANLKVTVPRPRCHNKKD
ncbi:hypothetical protein [Vibrio sp. PNB22_1_1]|uniref:hypothetical protein n=1 Tax=unclassified Vibrio TaxID=2614977 RepID=UPI00406A4871